MSWYRNLPQTWQQLNVWLSNCNPFLGLVTVQAIQAFKIVHTSGFSVKVVLHWSICNADSQRMFFARIWRHSYTCSIFEATISLQACWARLLAREARTRGWKQWNSGQRSLRQKSTAACYTDQFAPNSRTAVASFWIASKNLQRVTALQISQKIVRNGVLHQNNFLHNTVSSYRINRRCKSTSVTPLSKHSTAASQQETKSDPFHSAGENCVSLCHSTLCLLLLWKPVGNYCSFNMDKPQDKLFAGERNSRGKNGTSRLAKHRCTHLRALLFSPRLVLLATFFGTCKFSAARGNRNICVLTSKVLKLQSVPLRVPYKMISHWLPHDLYSSCWLHIPFSVNYASYLHELRKKVWWTAVIWTFLRILFVRTYEKFGEYGYWSFIKNNEPVLQPSPPRVSRLGCLKLSAGQKTMDMKHPWLGASQHVEEAYCAFLGGCSLQGLKHILESLMRCHSENWHQFHFELSPLHIHLGNRINSRTQLHS